MSFNKGNPPTIYCVNKAKTPLGITTAAGHAVSFADLCAALNAYVNSYVSAIWDCPATVCSAATIPAGGWGMVFLDDADQADAEGYHEYTDAGLPIAKVFVKTTLEAGDKVSVTAAHEIAEMLVDPAANLIASNEDGSILYAYEICDACEELDFPVNGVPMSDFVYPSWFEGFRQPGSSQFDYLGKITKPFGLLEGGYIGAFQDGEWTQLFGSPAKKKRFAKEDRRQHRTEERFRRFAARQGQSGIGHVGKLEAKKS